MVDEISPDELKAKIEGAEDVQIVDTREPDSYEAGHVPGAINIPMDRLPQEVDEYDWGEDIVCVCPIGRSSLQAARLIKSFEGVDDTATVRSMEGGYQAWDYELDSGRQNEQRDIESRAKDT